MFESPFDAPPLATNEIGTKFWADLESTKYARSKGLSVQVYYIEAKDGYRARVIVVNDNMVYSSTSMEAVGAYLDMMALAEKL